MLFKMCGKCDVNRISAKKLVVSHWPIVHCKNVENQIFSISFSYLADNWIESTLDERWQGRLRLKSSKSKNLITLAPDSVQSS